MRRDRDRLGDIAEAAAKIAAFAIDLDILWIAATRDVPTLATQIHRILDQLPPDPGS